MKYDPKPMNTDNVQLPPEIVELGEEIAAQIHDVWALQRMKEGWKYGPKRDDEKKETPCLVPYADLPESEKDYDRNTASATLKLIVKLGYRIEKEG